MPAQADTSPANYLIAYARQKGAKLSAFALGASLCLTTLLRIYTGKSIASQYAATATIVSTLATVGLLKLYDDEREKINEQSSIEQQRLFHSISGCNVMTKVGAELLLGGTLALLASGCYVLAQMDSSTPSKGLKIAAYVTASVLMLTTAVTGLQLARYPKQRPTRVTRTGVRQHSGRPATRVGPDNRLYCALEEGDDRKLGPTSP